MLNGRKNDKYKLIYKSKQNKNRIWLTFMKTNSTNLIVVNMA